MSGLFFYGVAAFAIVNVAILGIIAKKLETVIPPFAFIAITMTLLALSALLISLIFERSFDVKNISFSHAALILLFVFANLASFSLFLKAITGIPVPHYALIAVLAGPITSAVLAYFFLGQELTIKFFLALPIVFVGLYIALVR